jgi:hypothetical protein
LRLESPLALEAASAGALAPPALTELSFGRGALVDLKGGLMPAVGLKGSCTVSRRRRDRVCFASKLTLAPLIGTVTAVRDANGHFNGTLRPAEPLPLQPAARRQGTDAADSAEAADAAEATGAPAEATGAPADAPETPIAESVGDAVGEDEKKASSAEAFNRDAKLEVGTAEPSSAQPSEAAGDASAGDASGGDASAPPLSALAALELAASAAAEADGGCLVGFSLSEHELKECCGPEALLKPLAIGDEVRFVLALRVKGGGGGTGIPGDQAQAYKAVGADPKVGAP